MTVDVTTLHAPILVRRFEEKENAKGDIIIISETAKEKPQEDEFRPSEASRERRTDGARSMRKWATGFCWAYRSTMTDI
jgi:co-chaperonin GroES (HSP10)